MQGTLLVKNLYASLYFSNSYEQIDGGVINAFLNLGLQGISLQQLGLRTIREQMHFKHELNMLTAVQPKTKTLEDAVVLEL